MRRELLIVGLGLIGGSAGIALRRRGWRVRYVDPFVDVDEARQYEAADERAETVEGFVLLATPVDAAIETLRTLDGRTPHPPSAPSPLAEGRRGLVVTSVCSVMGPLRAAAGTAFVAGHPMAGSHERGLGAARGDLFEGKRWFVDAHHEKVDQLIRDCGAVPELVDAAAHDRAVALTSHLPQLLSTALAAHLGGHEDALRFAGDGLKTFLRLAGSDASVWSSIAGANADNIAPHAEAVARLVKEMLEGDPADTFARAQELWRKLR